MGANKYKIIVILLIMVFLVVGAEVLYKQEKKGATPVQIELIDQKTYEQGLWDGFNRTLEYLNSKGYLINDTMKVEITEVDSVLHSTKR